MSDYTSPPTPDPPAPIRRLTPGFEVEDDGSPGMFYKADGSLWLRDPLGAEVEIGSGNGGSQTVLSTTVVLNDADIKALPTVTFEVVAAPGPGKIICGPNGGAYPALLIQTFADLSSGYTNVDSIADLSFGLSFVDPWDQDVEYNVGGRHFNLNFDPTQWDDLNIVSFVSALDSVSPVGVVGLNHVENKPLVIKAFNGAVSLGDFTGGNPANTMQVTTFYSIVTIA